jgi:hypothetical protein
MQRLNLDTENRSERILSSIKDIFDYLVKESGLSGKGGKIKSIKDILFERMRPPSFDEHFKFDFSFPLNQKKLRNLRFTCNDFGEEKEFKEKVARIFSLFGPAFCSDNIKEVLKLSSNPLTFGMDWGQEKLLPRLKIYFETPETDIGLLKKICIETGIKFKTVSPYLKEITKICAYGIDFLGARAFRLKIYTYTDGQSGHPAFLTRRQVEKISRFRRLLSLESEAFFLGTYGFADNTQEITFKFYKIYSTKEFCSPINSKNVFYNRSQELSSLLKDNALGENHRMLIEDLHKISKMHGTVVYPISIGLNLPREDNKDLDLGVYLSVI